MRVALAGLETMDVVDISSSGSISVRASYRLFVVVELALVDLWIFAIDLLLGDVSERLRTFIVLQVFRGIVNWVSVDPSLSLIFDPAKLNTLMG